MTRPILYVHGIGSIGGAERDLLAWLRRLDRSRWNPIVACPERGEFRKAVEALRVPVAPIDLAPWRKLSSLLSRYASVRRLRELIDQHQPALIHVNDMWWVPHTLRAAGSQHGQRTPVVAHVRQAIAPEKARAYRLHRTDCVLAVSRYVAQALVRGGVQQERVQMLYSGIEFPAQVDEQEGAAFRASLQIPSNAVVVGTVANLLPIKGYEIMIEALPSILAKVPSVYYLIVGAGTEDDVAQLKNLSTSRAVDNRIRLAGFRQSTWPCLKAMDLYVQPSLNEAFGLATVEAMAMGKAVVASRVGGLPEIVSHDETGLLCSPGDAAEFGRAVVALLQDKEKRERMGALGAARVRERFDLTGTLRGLEQVYGEALPTTVN